MYKGCRNNNPGSEILDEEEYSLLAANSRVFLGDYRKQGTCLSFHQNIRPSTSHLVYMLSIPNSDPTRMTKIDDILNARRSLTFEASLQMIVVVMR